MNTGPRPSSRDRDSKFTKQFCSIIEDEGIEFREIAPPLSEHEPLR